MSNIELYVKPDCKKPCNMARDSIKAALDVIRQEGQEASFAEYNIRTGNGKESYESLVLKYPGRDLHLPLIVIDSEPFFSGASPLLAGRIVARVLHR